MEEVRPLALALPRGSEITMSFLARFRVLTKIIAVVVLMAAVAGGISWLGINALGQIRTYLC